MQGVNRFGDAIATANQDKSNRVVLTLSRLDR